MNLIVHTDGGSRSNPGPAACAAVFSWDGKVVAEYQQYLGIATNNEAEYQGLLLAMEHFPEWLEKLKPDHLIVRMDSKLVVEQMLGRWKIKEPRLDMLAKHGRRFLNTLGIKMTLEHVLRGQNKEADALVNACLDSQTEDL
jgi:ribonuclease HI